MKQNVKVAWFGIVVGVITAIFGAYILYEKAILPVFQGHSHERVGIVERSNDAFSFWLGVSVYGVCSVFVLAAGIYFAVRSIRFMFSSDK